MKFIDMTGWIMKEHGVSDSRVTVIERDQNKKIVMYIGFVSVNAEKYFLQMAQNYEMAGLVVVVVYKKK